MKMKKGLIALLLTLPMALTSCLDDSNSEPDPMAPGIAIYNAAGVKNQLALLPADAGIRLAMLLAEADKQDLTENRLDVKIKNNDSEVLLREKLFPEGTVITEDGTKYTLRFRKDASYYEGTVEVETNGVALSDDSAEWTIATSGLKADVNNGFNPVTYTYADGETTTISEAMGVYEIQLSGIDLSSDSTPLLSGWSGNYLMSVASSLAYSDCHGKEFKITGSGKDSEISWKATNVNYKGAENTMTGRIISVLLSGTVECALIGSYDSEFYPSPNVKVVFSNNGQSCTITYNGMVSQR